MSLLIALLLGLSVTPDAAEGPCAAELTTADATAIRAVVAAYSASWLANDAEGVLRTLTDDAVLLPAKGAAPIVGKRAIERYWWPKGAPVTVVTRLDITVEGLSGDCRVASAYGHDTVAWTQDENGRVTAHGHPGTYLNVFRKEANGTWRISHHMWDDGPSFP